MRYLRWDIYHYGAALKNRICYLNGKGVGSHNSTDEGTGYHWTTPKRCTCGLEQICPISSIYGVIWLSSIVIRWDYEIEGARLCLRRWKHYIENLELNLNITWSYVILGESIWDHDVLQPPLDQILTALNRREHIWTQTLIVTLVDSNVC